jgi:2-polyprenyl-3-methyl-5-hydroxy-6-metoxy-1,4-benzoquinol methylase
VTVGNDYDKYGTANPVARRLVARWVAALDDLLGAAAPASLLDLGCGEGVLGERWARRLGVPVVGADLAPHPDWDRRTGVTFRTVGDGPLPFEDGAFDAACALEVLEHVADPARILAELRRVARRHVLLSVPREPLWRALNVARGAHLRDLGNTPGHVNHWSRAAFVRTCAAAGEVVAVRSPLPWTAVLLRTGS